jgi:IS5 family transposase
MKSWFYGVREHLIVTPHGRVAFVVQVPGNRHDTQGLYALLRSNFQGRLLADNGYWPRQEKREALLKKGIQVTAAARTNGKNAVNTPEEKTLLKKHRSRIERYISLFNQQFHAERTLCRSEKHYRARRWAKALAYNASRHINKALGRPLEALVRMRAAA